MFNLIAQRGVLGTGRKGEGSHWQRLFQQYGNAELALERYLYQLEQTADQQGGDYADDELPSFQQNRFLFIGKRLEEADEGDDRGEDINQMHDARGPLLQGTQGGGQVGDAILQQQQARAHEKAQDYQLRRIVVEERRDEVCGDQLQQH